MIQKLCDDLNEYYTQFNNGDITKPIFIRPIKHDDKLLIDSVVFLNEKDKIQFEELQKNVNSLNAEKAEFLKKQQYDDASFIKKQLIEKIKRMETLMYKGSFLSNKTFSLTQDGVIVYTKRHIIKGKLFKRFFNID